ncbi:MAG TPA: DUF2262 domain-containing protein [Gemmataceae bacterium]|nr:DUF2262 domain-containing protein [Gemmataceae bacterium]
MSITEIDDPLFGRLVWYPRDRFYGGKMLLGGDQEILVSIDPEESSIDELLPQARRAMTWVLQNDERIRQLAAEQLTENYNRYCRDEEEDPEPISPAEFARRIQLKTFWFYPDGLARLGYDDSDMFGGHTIYIKCNPDSGWMEVEK